MTYFGTHSRGKESRSHYEVSSAESGRGALTRSIDSFIRSKRPAYISSLRATTTEASGVIQNERDLDVRPQGGYRPEALDSVEADAGLLLFRGDGFRGGEAEPDLDARHPFAQQPDTGPHIGHLRAHGGEVFPHVRAYLRDLGAKRRMLVPHIRAYVRDLRREASPARPSYPRVRNSAKRS